ncbi:MAG: ABC transporter ATP-binding protein [Candidatus Zixiibacteriota bacterium]
MLSKIRWLWKYYRRHPYVLSVLVFLTPVQAMISVTVPQLFGFAVDHLTTGNVSDHFVARWVIGWGDAFGLTPASAFGVAFIALGAFSCAFYAFVQSHRAWMNTKLEWEFRQDAFNQITTKGPDFFNKFRTGDIVTRLTDDVAEKLSWFACSGIFRLYEALLYVIVITVMMLSLDPWLTLWAAAPLPILVFIFFRSSSALDKRYDHLQTRISKFNDVMEACFSGVRVVKAYVRENAQKKKFEQAALERRKAELGAVRLTAVIESMYQYLWQIALVTVLVIGGYKVISSGLSVGALAAFIYYVAWLVYPMFDIGQFLVKSRQSAVSIDRLKAMEDVPPLVTDLGAAVTDSQPHGDIAFEGVTLTFPGSDRCVLDEVTMTIGAGQKIALVGRVGAGKSWLINQIPRLVDPTGGNIKLDGKELRQFRLEDLRRAIGYVPQEPVLFSDTIRNNILLGRDEIAEPVIEWAIDVAQLKDEIAAFPQGLDTTVGTRGMMLSGGQKQRLGLARALVGKPKILILDDCTSALDSRTEAALWDRLHQVMPGLTAILITHRPGTLALVDRVFVLDDGRIVESGTHHELINRAGQYAKIYRRYQLAEEVG